MAIEFFRWLVNAVEHCSGGLATALPGLGVQGKGSTGLGRQGEAGRDA